MRASARGRRSSSPPVSTGSSRADRGTEAPVRRDRSARWPGMARQSRLLDGFMSRNAASPVSEFFEDAACEDVDTSIFFPVSDTFAGDAKAICATCPVAEQCLEYAIETHQSDGVW